MYRGVGPRALSNGINSAVFFCFFEMLRSTFKQRKALVRTPLQEAQIIVAKLQGQCCGKSHMGLEGAG